MAKKIKIGDVFEIPTRKGLAYAQYTHEHSVSPRMGSLIRILPGFYDKRPSDFTELVKSFARFKIFFPLQATVNLKIIKIVANESVPIEERRFPVFRGGNPHPKTGKIDVWWFWDGKKSWKVGKITDEQKKMPLQRIVNNIRLIEMIESDWTPETDWSSRS